MFATTRTAGGLRARSLSVLRVTGPALAALLGLAALAPATAHAQTDGYRLDSGSVGVAEGQYARLNAYYVAGATGELPPGPCRVTLRFLDERGAVVAETVVSMRAGRAALLDVRPVVRPGQRATVRAEVLAERDASGVAPRVVASIEVIDVATGRTTIAQPGTIRGFNPQPEPPGDLPLFGVANQQVAHLTAAYVGLPGERELPPGPCRVTLLISSGDGTVLASREQTLAPGEAVSLDVAAGALPPGIRRRMFATVLTDGREQGAVLGTIELVDEATGKSAALFPADLVQSWGWE